MQQMVMTNNKSPFVASSWSNTYLLCSCLLSEEQS